MAPSLQVLIDFLLAEIALCGDQGMSTSAGCTFIHRRLVMNSMTCLGLELFLLETSKKKKKLTMANQGPLCLTF